MIQAGINICISILCSPVLSLIKHLLGNNSTEIQALWVGICGSCLVNGIVCLIKEQPCITGRWERTSIDVLNLYLYA